VLEVWGFAYGNKKWFNTKAQTFSQLNSAGIQAIERYPEEIGDCCKKHLIQEHIPAVKQQKQFTLLRDFPPER